jgi:dTDP-4-dehydrorhamnose reductase
MKIIVTGYNGQLGYDVYHQLIKNENHVVIGIGSQDLDITHEIHVKEFIEKEKPDVIIHCAAYTKVDQAEDDNVSCFDVNVNGTKYLVESAKKIGAKVVYISTDYVFSGDKIGQYEVNDLPNPKSVYGHSKYLGELETLKYDKHFIIRISWVFGKNGNNFVKTMLKFGKEKEFLKVVSDQTGSPTYTKDLAKLIVDMIETDKYGIYHATNEGQCSWYQFAKEIFRLSNIQIDLKPISSSEYPTKAKRPLNSLLSKESLAKNGFDLLPSWQDALKRCLKEIGRAHV